MGLPDEVLNAMTKCTQDIEFRSRARMGTGCCILDSQFRPQAETDQRDRSSDGVSSRQRPGKEERGGQEDADDAKDPSAQHQA